MPKKLDYELEKTSIRLVAGDMATLQSFYPQVGYNAAIRLIVHRHCTALREKESREGVAQNVQPDPSIDAIFNSGELASGD